LQMRKGGQQIGRQGLRGDMDAPGSEGDDLTRFMIRCSVGCRIEETLLLKKVDEDFFAD